MAAPRDRQDVSGTADAGATTGKTTTESTAGVAGTRGSEGIGATETERSVPIVTEGARGVRGRATGLQPLGWPGFFSSPFDLMQQMQEDVNNLFENFGVGRAPLSPWGYQGLRHGAGVRGTLGERGGQMVPPDIEVLQRSNAVVVRADLPGLEPNDINVTVDDGALVISGERQREQREEREGYVRSEVRYGTFYRSVPLPRGADEDKIAANFKNGVLEVTVPITEHAQGKKIAIKT